MCISAWNNVSSKYTRNYCLLVHPYTIIVLLYIHERMAQCIYFNETITSIPVSPYNTPLFAPSFTTSVFRHRSFALVPNGRNLGWKDLSWQASVNRRSHRDSVWDGEFAHRYANVWALSISKFHRCRLARVARVSWGVGRERASEHQGTLCKDTSSVVRQPERCRWPNL